MIAPNHNVSISSSDLEAVNPDLARFRLANGSVPGSSADSDSLPSLQLAGSNLVGNLPLKE
jgi:hypothetical protein